MTVEFDYYSAMHFFRRRKNLKLLPWLLACAVLLRSFIAPGYMLSASAEDGLGIIFCDGPASLVSESEHSGHHHHDGGENQAGVHISPICSKWSTSSLLLVPYTDIVPVFALYSSLRETPDQQSAIPRQFPFSKRIIRGPPHVV